MNVDRRELGIAVSVTGVVLWLIALAVGAPTIATILPILLLMGGGVLLVTADRTR